MAEERIMSMELAIKRELAYREKLARLYPEHDWKNEFVPLEVPSSRQNPSSALLSEPRSSSVVNYPNNTSSQNLCSRMQNQDSSLCSWTKLDMAEASTHSVTKGNTTFGTFQFLPNQHLLQGPDRTRGASHQLPSSIAVLGLSRVESRGLNSSIRPNLDMASNNSVNKEKTNASSFQSLQQPRPLDMDNTNLFCLVCKVHCTSSHNYRQHVKGQKHKARLRVQKTCKNNGGDGLNTHQQPMCNVCEIWCTDETSLQLHFQGQKHQAKLKEIEVGGQKRAAAPKQMWCELCQIPCANEDTFRMHLNGKNHAARLQATLNNNNRAI